LNFRDLVRSASVKFNPEVIRKQTTEQLFRAWHEPLVRFATAILGDSDEASDVVSDVFERITSGRLPGEDSVSESWLRVVVRNQCRDVIRKKQRTERLARLYPVDDSAPWPTPEQQEARWSEIVRFAETQFPPQMERVFRLRYGQLRPCKDIAEELGVSQAAVYKHLAHALRMLREHFKNTEDDE